MKITNWKANTYGGKRLGTFDVTTPAGFTFIGCSAVLGDNGHFVGLPQQSYTGRDGTKKYSPCVKIEDREKGDKFGAAVIEALRQEGCIQ